MRPACSPSICAASEHHHEEHPPVRHDKADPDHCGRHRDHRCWMAVDAAGQPRRRRPQSVRSEEHTSELQSLMRISYAVFCLKKKTKTSTINMTIHKLKPLLTIN